MKLPSNRYFELVKTEEDLAKLISTGMAWEVEPNLPNTWQDHLDMVEYKKNLAEEGEEE